VTHVRTRVSTCACVLWIRVEHPEKLVIFPCNQWE
jgi:hypothetical protein